MAKIEQTVRLFNSTGLLLRTNFRIKYSGTLTEYYGKGGGTRVLNLLIKVFLHAHYLRRSMSREMYRRTVLR